MATTFTKGRIYKLNPTELLSDPQQARKFMDPNGLQELAASIRKHGVLEPILFRQEEESKLFIVAGERRTAAVKMVGLTTIPGIYVDGDHQEISLVENLLRVDLTPVEEAEALEALMKEKGYSQYNLSDMIGKSQPAIAQIVSLNRLPVDVKDQCRTNPNIPRSALLEVVKSKTEQGMRNAFQKMIAQRAAAEAGTTKPGAIRLSKVPALIQAGERPQRTLGRSPGQRMERGRSPGFCHRPAGHPPDDGKPLGGHRPRQRRSGGGGSR